nr:immunoglobulin heavy chain junction region [Mus musculus]
CAKDYGSSLDVW